MDFSKAVYSDRPAILVAIDVVRKIVAENPAPYTLMLSGGVDSQAMFYAWHLSGVPFSIMNVEFHSNGIFFNEDDCADLHSFVPKFGTYEIQTRKLDILSFLDSELPVYARTYYCTSPQICAHMKFIDLVEHCGTVVYSGNFMQRSPPFNFTILGLDRFAQEEKRVNLIPFFFMHDPELAVAFRENLPRHSWSINTFDSSRSYNGKCEVFRAGGFPVVNQTLKMTGFEHVKEYFDDKTHLITRLDRLKHAHQPSKRVFDLLYRYRFNESIKYIDEIQMRLTT